MLYLYVLLLLDSTVLLTVLDTLTVVVHKVNAVMCCLKYDTVKMYASSYGHLTQGEGVLIPVYYLPFNSTSSLSGLVNYSLHVLAISLAPSSRFVYYLS
jgi:hypothetical protein